MKPKLWREYRLSALSTMIGFLLTGLIGGILHYAALERERARFDALAETDATLVQERLNLMASLLRSVGALFSSGIEIDARNFAFFVGRLRIGIRYPGVDALVWCPRVRPDQKQSFLEWARREVSPNFQIWPNGEGDQFPMVFIEPISPARERLRGFDPHSEASRRQTLLSSVRSGLTTLSPPIRLIQDETTETPTVTGAPGRGQAAGFGMWVPVFDEDYGAIPESLDARTEKLKGFCGAGFRAGEFLSATFEGGHGLAEITLIDRDLPPHQPLAVYLPQAPGHKPRYRAEREIKAWGRVWKIRIASRPEFEAQAVNYATPLVLWLGGFLTLVAGVAIRRRQALSGELALSKAELLRANRELEARVAERTQQLQATAAELVTAEQKERARIAQILHDDLQQTLVATKMFAAGLSAPEDQARKAQIVELVASSIQTARSLSQKLDPAALKDRDLAAGLEWAARKAVEEYGLDVALDLDPAAEPASPEIKLFLVRSAGELLLNVVKHAGVNRATLSLARVDALWVKVTVADEGAGCGPNAAEAALSSQHFGLFSIKNRLELLGGRFEMRTADGQGCEITLYAPVAALPA